MGLMAMTDDEGGLVVRCTYMPAFNATKREPIITHE
jgi:hypothetical protein